MQTEYHENRVFPEMFLKVDYSKDRVPPNVHRFQAAVSISTPQECFFKSKRRIFFPSHIKRLGGKLSLELL